MHVQARRLPGSALLFLWIPLATRVLAQSPRIELDHIYIVVQPPVSRRVDALRRVGLTVDTTVQRHAGEGTASVAALLENGYLELLWVDSATPVDSAHLEDLADFRRAADWRESGASPFGIGLHLLSGNAADLPVPVRRDPAPHLGADAFYSILRQRGETSAADLFVVPASASITTWIDRRRALRPALFAHPLGARRLTRVTLHGAPANRPRAMDLDLGPVRFESAPTQYVTVEFDGGLQGREWDLRPALPLVLRR
jgi:hypothetical protein